MTGHIFISYSHEDGDFAEILGAKLRVSGLTIWKDEDGISGGDTWRETIDQAIREAAALIVVMSPDAKESDYVTYEWAFALGVGIRVIPVPAKPTDLHPRLQALQHRDFTSRSARPWDKLIEDLTKDAYTGPSSSSVSQNVPHSIKDAVTALNSANADQRKNAIQTLEQMKHSETCIILIEALECVYPDVRRDAARALGDTGYIEAIPGLIRTLHDMDSEVRSAATEALINIGIYAVPYLIEALKNKDTKIYLAVSEAVIEIGPGAVSL